MPVDIFKTVPQITTIIMLAAFAIAIIGFLSYRKSGRVTPGSLISILAVVLVAIGASVYSDTAQTVYRVRVTVVGPSGTPVNDAKVWSTIGGEPKRVEGGWEFSIPQESKPTDGKFKVFASLESAFLTGSHIVELGIKREQSVTLELKKDDSAQVRGVILDRRKMAVEGALVTVVGYGSESVSTGKDGQFALPAHSAKNQQVQLHAEKKGLGASTEWEMAGDSPATIVLGK